MAACRWNFFIVQLTRVSVQTLTFLRKSTCKEAGGKDLAWMQCSHLRSEISGPHHLWSLTQLFGNALTAVDVSRKERKKCALWGVARPPLLEADTSWSSEHP